MLLKGKEFVEHSSGLWVANDGEVFVPKSGKRNEHFTYGNTDYYGYKRVKYKGKIYRVHRLVAETFIPNPNNYPTVDHIDRNSINNIVENLRWADMSLQCYNRVVPKNNAKSKKVLQYTLEGELVREWPSVKECSRNGFYSSHVSNCCSGKYKTHKGYIWRYKEGLEEI